MTRPTHEATGRPPGPGYAAPRMALTALIRRPSRVAQLEQLLNRYRWTNAGLRERLDQLTTERDLLTAALADAGHPTTMTPAGTVTIHGEALR